jgi:DNA polymerase III delta prime subunit
MDTPFLYKYSPKTLDTLGYDRPFIDLLRVHIEMDDLNILFVGDPGTGKTTLVRIITQHYYGDAYSQDNVLIVNSINDKGIIQYRTCVKTFCQTCSVVPGKKKLVILDDIEHVNEQIQQVFRNCIEKYSHNVSFIATCTDTQNVNENLQSTMSIMRIEKISNETIEAICDMVCLRENIHLTDEAKTFLIRISGYSVRTMLNYLEKGTLLTPNNEILTLRHVEEMCTNITFAEMEAFTEFCASKKLNEAIQMLYAFYDQGFSVIDILDNYFTFIKLTKQISERKKYSLIEILIKYTSMFYTVHEDEIELAFFTNRAVDILSA